MTVPDLARTPDERARLWWEIAIVLGLSLGASAVYAIVDIVIRMLSETPLGDQAAGLNPSQDERAWADLVYQVLGIGFGVVPVMLAIYLLWRPGQSAFARIGLTVSRPGRDIAGGFLLFAAIGIPGIALYAIGRMLGITVAVQASGLDAHWWTVPVLILSALRAALLEEVIVVGYLFTRLRQLGWRTWMIVGAAALLRGSYHLYQGFGPFIGNAVMGVVFGWFYVRFGRVAPLVIAHLLLDVVSFVGYPLAASWWPEIFSVG